LEYVLALIVLLALVAIVVLRPLTRAPEVEDQRYDPRRAELEAAKEAKYREIRDAELDHNTGKMSDGDWRSLDRTLRAEAVELLKRLDRVHERAESLP
jgi:flagellar biosynthesis/type III secretory pathway M-ring protein FliF/YscJ